MNTSAFTGDNKFDEVDSLSRAMGLLDTYDPCNFIDAMQAAGFRSTFRRRFGLPLGNNEIFWNDVVSSLQGRDSKAKK